MKDNVEKTRLLTLERAKRMRHYYRDTRSEPEPDVCRITGKECMMVRTTTLFDNFLTEGDCRLCVFAQVQFKREVEKG